MPEYKDTLNLPATEFPMKANLPQREPGFLKNWYEKDIYGKIREKRKNSKKFILHDGPPYANGHLHCGHALNKILKDIIIKAKTLSDFNAPFVPGWDCHGLPIELNVEKKIGKVGLKVSANEFRHHCRKYASEQIKIQKDEFIRLGVFADWENPYTTMDSTYEANIVRALGRIIAEGHIEQGFKPVNWCIDCRSALAEAEVDYEEKTSPSIDAAFIVSEKNKIFDLFKIAPVDKSVIVPIWTTTPWTLPANQGVCLNPEISYALIEAADKFYVIAKDLVDEVMRRYQILDYQTKGFLNGINLEGLFLQHPFYERKVPIVLGSYVNVESGTGAVHIASAHGIDDYNICKKYNLNVMNVVLGNGCYTPEVPLVAGQSVLKVNPKIIDLLQENNNLLSAATLTHNYPHCWRHKSPIIFLATPQWFVSMEKHNLRNQTLKLCQQVNWVPDWGQARIEKMIENRPEWCISRQRAWGTPIPVFVHKETRVLHPKTKELIEQIAKGIEIHGIDYWFDLDSETILGTDAKDYDKITDTLDVWFDSGVSHFCVLRHNQQLQFPADVYFEGSDQYRGWFNSSITTSAALTNQAPYKTVLSHGYTVDSEGKKLSKSKGNYVALDKLINQHGADILRLWVASTDYRYEVSISEEIIKRNGDAYRRIRNTARFLLANIFDFDPAKVVKNEKLVELDKWIISRCQILQSEIIDAYEKYQFHLIYQKIHNFCSVDLSSFYLDIIKDRQYTTAKDSIARRSCQTAMYHIIHALTRWLAPILSFTAEEIWQHIADKDADSIFLQSWYESWPALEKIDLDFWETIQILRSEVNKILEQSRKEGLIGSTLEAKIDLYADDKLFSLLNRIAAEINFIFIASDVQLFPLTNQKNTIKIQDMQAAIKIDKCTTPKCARCWHRTETVGLDQNHADICYRCVGNITGKDEKRFFA